MCSSVFLRTWKLLYSSSKFLLILKIYSGFSLSWSWVFGFFFIAWIFLSYFMYLCKSPQAFCGNGGMNDSCIKHRDTIYFYCITTDFFFFSLKAKRLWRTAADCGGTCTPLCPSIHTQRQAVETELCWPKRLCGLWEKVRAFPLFLLVSLNRISGLHPVLCRK